MQVRDLDIPGVKLIGPPARHGDDRGWFCEHFSARTHAAAGLTHDWVQDNLSFSRTPGTIRGLHFQPPPSAQAKLVSVLAGAVLDVVVDLRHGSPTFGRHVAVELSAEDGRQLLAPRGVAHGLCTLEPDTLVHYKVDGFYDAARDLGLAWDDPELGIAWPDFAGAVVSDKDRRQPRLAELPVWFRWGEDA